MYRQDDLDQKALDDKIRGKELWAETVKAQTERWKAEAIAKAALPRMTRRKTMTRRMKRMMMMMIRPVMTETDVGG